MYTIGLLKSSESELNSLCQTTGRDLGIDWHVQGSASAWLLEMLQEDCAVALLDCEKPGPDELAWIKLARRLRPKVSLIVIYGSQIDTATGVDFCKEQVFYFCSRPVDCNLLQQVLQAAVRSFYAPK